MNKFQFLFYLFILFILLLLLLLLLLLIFLCNDLFVFSYNLIDGLLTRYSIYKESIDIT